MKSRLHVGAVPNSEALVSTTRLRSRPIEDAITNVAPQTPETRLQAKSEAAIAKHDFGQIPVLAGVQAKLTIGAPNDQYEQEADRVADQVMSSPGAGSIQRMDNEEDEVQMKPLAGSITPLIQRVAEEDELQTKPIQREAEEDELQTKPIQREAEEDELQAKPIQREAEEDELQMKATPSAQRTAQTHTAFETRLNQSRGSGSALPDATRSFMESRFGADLSHVRIHTGSDAVQMSREIGAQAFTHGRDIYFNSGKFDASSDTGKHLLAHELTHVVQQTGAAPLSVQRRVDLGLLRSSQTPAIQCFDPNSNSSSGGSTSTPTSTPSSTPTSTPSSDATFSVAIALWRSTAVTPTREAGESIQAEGAGETEATTAYNRLRTAINTVESLMPTYRDTGRVAVKRRLLLIKNNLLIAQNKLVPHAGGELATFGTIAQFVNRTAQSFSQSKQEIAREGAVGNNAAERAIARRTIAAMWDTNVVTAERNIGRTLQQPGASSETAGTAIQQTDTIKTTVNSVIDALRANQKEPTARLAALGYSRLNGQISMLEPHAGSTPSLESIAIGLGRIANGMEEFTAELYPPIVIESHGGGV